MTLENKCTLTTNAKTGEVKIEVTSTAHPIDELIAMILKGLIKGGAMP